MLRKLAASTAAALAALTLAATMSHAATLAYEGDDGDLNPQPLPPIVEEAFGLVG
jgi:hypothetical protein